MFDLSQYHFNPGFQWYEAVFSIDHSQVKLTVSAESETTVHVLETRLKNGIRWFSDYSGSIISFAAKQLLSIKNEEWLQEGESPLDEKMFTKALKIARININADGSMSFYYNAGNLFWGHVIVVEVKSDYTFNYANIEG